MQTMIVRQAQNIVIALLLVLIALTAVACSIGGADLSTPVAQPTTPGAGTSGIVTTSPNNSLRVVEPLPGTSLLDSVTVRGEGTAFENTINVEILSDKGVTLGKATTLTDSAQPDQAGQFTATLTIAPVTADTNGIVKIYTTSAKDGSI